jgi:glycerophosphoryl diester phosphodiesterase
MGASSRLRALGALTAAVAGVAALGAVPAAAAPDWTKHRVLNISHQGGEDEAPSATMYALERTMQLGSDMLEVDIHTTKDGKLVVIHDSTVDRTTNGSGQISGMTLKQVQALDAAHNFVPGEGVESDAPESAYRFRGIRTGERKPPPGFRANDFRIPTLAQVMRRWPTVPINIEIKGNADTDQASYNRNAETLAAFLNRLGRTRGIIVASFNDAALERFNQRAPRIDLAPAIARVAAFKLANVPPGPAFKVFQVPMSFNGITVTDQDFVDRAHGIGMGVHVWTINDPPTMRELVGLGVDGIMTATPGLLEETLCADRVPRPPRPSSFGGRHCGYYSIACEVRPISLRRARKGRVKVRLERGDEFRGRCAGRVGLRVPGIRGRARARFDFGPQPPAAGGPKRRTVTVKPSKRLRKALRKDRRATLRARPYHAFSERARLKLTSRR